MNEILDLATVEAGRMELEPTEFALDEMIRGAIAFVRERAAQHRIELTTDVAPDTGTLLADERKVRQVLLNLLSNAVKFTPDGGGVGVRCRRTGGEVEVSVRDTGIGIGPEDLPKIFEEFQQVGGPRSAHTRALAWGSPWPSASSSSTAVACGPTARSGRARPSPSGSRRRQS